MEIQNTTITISEASQATTQSGKMKWKIKDENGRTYGLWQTKQDGNFTKAYEVLQTLPNNGLGKAVQIGYKEDRVEGYKYPIKTIVTMNPDAQPQQPQQQPQPQQNQQKQQQPDWDKISWGKCKTNFLVEAFKKGMTVEEAEPICEQWADAAMRKRGEAQMKDYGDGEQADQVPFPDEPPQDIFFE